MTKILMLSANPSNLDQLQIAQESRAITLALRLAAFSQQFQVVQSHAVRVSDLQDQLLHHQPDIVHFSGHGSAAHELLFEDATGQAQAVSAAALGKLFRVHQGQIRCVVLNACHSIPQAEAIGQAIDCVVGMSADFLDETAKRFAAAFYRTLGDGKSVRVAFATGTLELELENLHGAEMPQLYTRQPTAGDITFVETLNEAQLAAQAESQARYRTTYEEFLLPLSGALHQTKTIFAKLYDSRNLMNLEYHPGRLQAYFTALPAHDPRKQVGMLWIELLQRTNQENLALVKRFYGRILSSALRKACDDYLVHIQEWEIVWSAFKGQAPMPEAPITDNLLLASRFPDTLEPALQAEMDEVRKRAGIKEDER